VGGTEGLDGAQRGAQGRRWGDLGRGWDARGAGVGWLGLAGLEQVAAGETGGEGLGHCKKP
jgi:hypothetical protein